ncbi:MAG: amidohydrolase family protein [Acidobacteriota bacterium]
MRNQTPIAVAGLWLAASVAAFAGAETKRPATLRIAAARVLEVETGKILLNQVLTIESGLIRSLDNRASNATIDLDLGDVTLLPGLIDAHTHLAGSEEETPYDRLRETGARAAVEGVANARKILAAGFTTVRDLGSRDFADVALRDAIAAGHIPGPRMLVSVASLSPTGGHGDDNELPADVNVQRYRAIADGPDEIRKKVRENIKYGADWIKLLATGGVMSAGSDPRASYYTEDELRVAVETARAKGRDVAVHAHGTDGILLATRAGARSIEHASMLDDACLALIKERGTFIVPNPYTNVYMLERGAAGGYQPYQLEKGAQIKSLKMESLRKAIRAGVQIAYGTDSGVQPHGLNARQFALYVEAGMTPLQAIQSATLVDARLLRMEGKIGTLKPGAFADIVAVKGNPLDDITTLERPVAVFKQGERF